MLSNAEFLNKCRSNQPITCDDLGLQNGVIILTELFTYAAVIQYIKRLTDIDMKAVNLSRRFKGYYMD